MTDSLTLDRAFAVLRRQEPKGKAKYTTLLHDAGLTPLQLAEHEAEEAADQLAYAVTRVEAMRALMAGMPAAPEPHRCAYCDNYPAITMREGWEIGGRIADVWAIDCGCEQGNPVKGETLQSALAVWCHHNAPAEPVKQAATGAAGYNVADGPTDTKEAAG